MPKRKLADLAEPSAPQSLQAIRLSQKFDQSVIVLSRAFKAARGSERQKMGRREKTAKAQPGGEGTLARLAEEVQVLKVSLSLSLSFFFFLFLFLGNFHRLGCI